MKKNFKKLVCIGIACFCMLSATGQENNLSSRMLEREDIPQGGVNLRVYSEYFWPDSAVRFNAAGAPTSKTYYNKVNRTETGASLENGSWKTGEPKESEGIHWWIGKVEVREYNGQPLFIHPQLSGLWGETNLVYTANFSYKHTVMVYDVLGNLIRVEFRFADFPDIYNEHRISYNERNNPVLIEMYAQKSLWGKIQYKYDENGYMTLHERYHFVNNNWIITNDDYKQTAEYDELGKPVGEYFYDGSASLNQWVLRQYTIYYYSDKTNVSEPIKPSGFTAYLINKTLYIQSAKTERIAIYSITGSNLFETTIQPGLTTINAASFPQGVLIVIGSSGSAMKLLNR